MKGNELTPWLMKPGGLMPHSQGLSNNPYPQNKKPNSLYFSISLRSILILSSDLQLGFFKGLFPVSTC